MGPEDNSDLSDLTCTVNVKGQPERVSLVSDLGDCRLRAALAARAFPSHFKPQTVERLIPLIAENWPSFPTLKKVEATVHRSHSRPGRLACCAPGSL